MSKLSFERFLEEQNDIIDNAFHDALASLATGEDFEWDMELIGDLTEAGEEILREHGIECCHPYYEGKEETPCYLGEGCKNTVCKYRALISEG